MKLLLATKNKDKVKELKNLLEGFSVELLSASDFPEMPDVVEDEKSLEGNAIKKAKEMAIASKTACISDDTGLFIDALNGEPGLYSARFAGENCSYQDNRFKVLDKMKNVENRKARFETAVALVDSCGNLIGTASGKVEGDITTKEIGDKGFGYDSIFRCEETGKTFGEMSLKEKQKISHRARAFRNILPIIKNNIR